MTVLPGAGPTDHHADDHHADGFDVRWLDLRVAADDRARSGALMDELAVRLPPSPQLLDVGAGTGAMQRWCDDRLPSHARWTLLDPDRRLLDVARARGDGSLSCVRGSVSDVSTLLAGDVVDAVVCSALLDVLPPDEIAALVGATSAAGVPLLAALTVTGEVDLDPVDPDDAAAVAAVRTTATGRGAAGPAAAAALRVAAARVGASVREQATPWQLSPGRDDELLRGWTAGYLASALAGASEPGLARWADDRRAAAAAHRLHVTVQHVDVLVVPA